MLHLKLWLLLLCLIIDLSKKAQAKQQCRLQLNNDIATAPSIPTSIVPSPNSSTPSSSSNFPSPTPSRTPFNYSEGPVRGVNLGGWFVLEPWITPSIFEATNDDTVVDEYTLGMQTKNYNETLAMLQNHWNTWITEDDFIAINEAGLNHVRIPLGYWSVPLPSSATNTSTSISPYIPGAWPYLLRALNWAAAHNVHVILDLHGAPGSQNGYDNSGQRTSDPQWALNTQNVTRSIDTLVYIAQQIGGMIDILELVNESAGFFSSEWASVTRSFFSNGYAAVRNAVGDTLNIMIGDAFLGVDAWDGFLTYPTGVNALMDNHQYQIFSIPELQRSFSQHLAFTCTIRSTISSFAAANIWTIEGEWSTAPTDCALWLNGRGVGARWDDSYNGGASNGSCNGWTGNYTSFSSEYKTFLRQYWEAQVDIGESAQGWVYWAWKASFYYALTESADEWSYQKGLEGGWIPADPTQRMYPDPCSNSSGS
ncbi:glycoside hydrolase [Lentinula aff. lateritia]|uniref:Glycoside hydrolase n=1 Tax=Lentinula aff. lateritia TaxID=2804960 RepID=A0ACC1UEI8_9AGAR|nr:glycoside hydrolase [Lentinula aff. lateritia]